MRDAEMIYDHYVKRADSRRRLLPALLCSLLFVFSLATFAGPAGAAGCGGVKQVGDWTTIQGPHFGKGPQTITSHVVDPADARNIFVTNGAVVSVSRDGGCSWKQSYAGDDLVTLAGSYQIESLISPVTGAVGALIRQETAGNSRPVLEITRDNGKTWHTGGTGLPPTGDPEFVRSSPSSPTTVYLGVDTGDGTLDLLFVSTDGGETFSLRSDVSQSRANEGVNGLVIDPLNTQSLWAHGPGGLFHSTNGGASFTPVPEFTGLSAGPVEVVHSGGDPAKIIVFTPGRSEFRSSPDGGKKWFRGDSPAGVDSVTHGFSAADLVLSAQGEAYKREAASFTWRDINAPVPGIKAMSAHRSGTLSYFGHTGNILERWFAPPPDKNCVVNCSGLPGDSNISLVAPPEQIAKESRLSPQGERIRLKPGASRTVRYRLDMPQRPVPLDVYFLVDTSNSMYETLAGLRRSIQGIVNGLADEGIDVEFGVGEYRAYPDSCPPGQDDANFVYRQDADIQPVGSTLEQALESLTPDAGGVFDSHLGALYQTATGAGQDIFPTGTSNDQDVEPGQQATFRQKALRVVINATDEIFGREAEREDVGQNLSNPACALQPTPDIPSFDEVIEAFNDRNVKQVGLSIRNTAESSYDDLARVAQGTNTIATTPVDCDGDGDTDVQAKAPLVCQLRPTGSQDGLNLVPAVVGLLNSVQDKVDVGLSVTKASASTNPALECSGTSCTVQVGAEGSPVVQSVAPQIHPDVLLQTAKRLEFGVRFHCSKEQAGKKFNVHLSAASVVPLPQAVADATVLCAKLPKKKRIPPVVPAIVPPLIPTVGAIAAAPPPPPPAPVSNLSSASQAQSQAQAQGATATQEQEEPQLALAQAYFEAQDDAEYELAMVSYTGKKNYLPMGASVAMGVVVVSLMGSGLVAMRRRERKNIHPAYAKRSRY